MANTPLAAEDVDNALEEPPPPSLAAIEQLPDWQREQAERWEGKAGPAIAAMTREIRAQQQGNPYSSPLTTHAALLNSFAIFDTDGNGKLSKAELRNLLCRPSAGTTGLDDEDIDEILSDFDRNGDGELSIYELAGAFVQSPWLAGESVDAMPDEEALLAKTGEDRGRLLGVSHINLDAKLLSAADSRALGLLLAADPKRKLARLDLAHNPGIGDEGLSALIHNAIVVDALTNLFSLDLNDCGIGDDGAMELAAALKHLPKLASLTLQQNRFGEAGAAALNAALAAGSCPELTQISF